MSGLPEARPKAQGGDAEHDAAAEAEAEAEAAARAERIDSIEALRSAGDVEGLVRLARCFRAGTAGVARDLSKCFDAYRAASDLGSATASHALGLFYLHGGPVAPDEMEAAKRFRAAADAGHLAAKVIVANFYEIGIHYRADPAKSDLWYRNVSRAAGIEDAPGTPAFDRAMAELGCVRHALAVVELPDTSAADRTKLLRIARIHGHREGRASITPEALAEEEIASLERPTDAPAPVAESLAAGKAAAGKAAPGKTSPGKSGSEAGNPEGRAPKATEARTSKSGETAADKEPRPSRLPKTPPVQVGLGLTAFFFSTVCMAVAVVAGHVGPPFLVERALPIPVLGTRFDLVLPALLLVVGALPNLLVYRLSAWIRSALLGGAAAVAGEVLWGVGRHFFSTRVMQVSDLAAAGFLAGLLVFGIFGGAKPGSR